MGRKKSTEKTMIVSFRVPESQYNELESLMELALGGPVSVSISVGDIARTAMQRGLPALARELKRRTEP